MNAIGSSNLEAEDVCIFERFAISGSYVRTVGDLHETEHPPAGCTCHRCVGLKLFEEAQQPGATKVFLNELKHFLAKSIALDKRQ